MKKFLFVIATLMMTVFISFSQTPPHPNGGGGPTGGNTPVGGGAPIDGGLSVLMVLATAYGFTKSGKQLINQIKN